VMEVLPYRGDQLAYASVLLSSVYVHESLHTQIKISSSPNLHPLVRFGAFE
jgi:hypothetical protein